MGILLKAHSYIKQRGIRVGIRVGKQQGTRHKLTTGVKLILVNVIHLQGTISLFTGTTSQLTG